VVLIQTIDLNQDSTDEDLCDDYGSGGNGMSTSNRFLNYSLTKIALKPDHTYTFEINSPQAGNEDLVFPIGTFEYRNGIFISTGNIN
jgi:hypothetical protein